MAERRTNDGAAEPAQPSWRRLPEALLEREALCTAVSGSQSLDALFAASDDDQAKIAEIIAAYEPVIAQAQAAFDEALSSDDPFSTPVAVADLDPIEARVFALCAAIDQDRRLQQLAARAQGDATAIRPSVDLIARLLGGEAVGALADDARLAAAALLQVEPAGPFGSAVVEVPRRVAWSLRGDLSLDPLLPLGAEIQVVPVPALGAHDLVIVHGDDSVRRIQQAVLQALGLAFLVIDEPADDRAWRVVVRQATLGGLGVVLRIDERLSALGRYWVERADHLAWALTSERELPLDCLPRRDRLELAAESAAVSDAEWSAVYGDEAIPASRPAAEQLRLAAAVAGRGPAESMRRLASGTLGAMARRVVPSAGWKDLILAAPLEARLRELVDRFRYRETVHDTWGLPLYPSPGVVALFSGPSGTGKTTAAEVIAGELGVDLFRVDLSSLVSKYIGETEKNLEQIFSAAHAGNYLLLFDEADSLFGSRSKVSDARDRYANMEVSYLLQRLETYDGFVVLTSNFQGNIDQAFLRRMHGTVHFQVPAAEDRKRIWQRSLAQAPTVDLDLDFVAEKFDLTGGSIRNAALGAAFLAAAGAGAVDMAYLLRAIAAELTKLGRRATPDQFGQWAAAVTPSLGG